MFTQVFDYLPQLLFTAAAGVFVVSLLIRVLASQQAAESKYATRLAWFALGIGILATALGLLR